MNIDRLLSRRRLTAFLLLGGCVVIAVLAAALSIVALRPPLVRIVPDASRSMVVRAGRVPDAAARAFAMLYVMRLDNYTPATAETLSGHLQQWVAPSCWGRAVPVLERRSRLAREGRLCSQVIIPDEKEVVVERNGEELRVVVPALRRHFVSGASAIPVRMSYRLRLEISAPGAANPYGLVVAEQQIEEVVREDSGRHAPVDSYRREHGNVSGAPRDADAGWSDRPF